MHKIKYSKSEFYQPFKLKLYRQYKIVRQPDIVPDKIRSPLNKKILIGIGIAVVLFHIAINFFIESETADNIVLIFSIVTPLSASIIGLIVAFRYAGAKIFQKAYLSLAAGYFAIFLGEITYLIYDYYYPELDPYPSIADVFFFIQYPMILIHLLLNIRFFSLKLNKISKIWIAVFPIGIFVIFAILSGFGTDDFEPNFDFYYGTIFVYLSSLTLSVAVIGAIIFKGGVVGKAWLLLLIGILFNTIGDTWYYNLEIFVQYDLVHPVNLFWYAGYLTVIYALIKHKNIL